MQNADIHRYIGEYLHLKKLSKNNNTPYYIYNNRKTEHEKSKEKTRL